ncbi:hypothetical protein IWW43_004456 [Coemansia sp. RSA 1935]|nr:hypothetical protein GGF45_000117 [Coemansia sp. RSA 551]KAJ2530210.1 hypothetical protein IWW43_004456 [Coemansia sp. RSA 1935]
MDGKFTFRADRASLDEWDAPDTNTIGDSYRDTEPQSANYHHHVHHHYHYLMGKPASGAATPRRRYAPIDSEPEDQDPLTLWHSTHAQTGETASASSAYMEDLLTAHGIGQEWAASTVRRPTALTSSSVPDDEFRRCNPHWDDMITFRQTRVRVPRERAWSATSETMSHMSASGVERNRLLAMATHTIGRTVCLTVLPVTFVVAWCSVPLRTNVVWTTGESNEKLNFWFFLVFYYGAYNAVALALVTQIFRVYSLTWWPRGMSGVLANVTSWVFTTMLGALVYVLDTGVERMPMTWTSLTLLTLLLPVVVSFGIIQRHHQHTSHDEQRPLMATSTAWRTPASYRRFVWFCSTFLLWYAALAAGEWLASVYIDTLPHTTSDEFFYVYTWIAIVNILSLAAGWVVSAKVRSWPLQYVYTLYFFTTYFIFYRNLFARLENPEQVVLLQASASVGIALVYPLRMARWVYCILAFVCRWGDDYPYEAYVRHLGRAFFLRNKAENATVLGFVCWVTILHYGPNRLHYPYFRFEQYGDVSYEYSLTVRASIYAWMSEFVASRIVRFIFRRVYKLNISADAVHDFCRYPHVVAAMVLVTIHVLQNILFAMIRLDFG